LQHGRADLGKGGAVTLPAGKALTLSHCLVTANATTGSSNADPLISAGGAVSALGTLNVQSSTFSDNNSSGPAGAIYASPTATLGIENTTMSENTADYAGAIYAQAGTTDLRNVTITGNASRAYGGVYTPGEPVITLRNTIIAGNTATQYDPDCSGVLTSAGYNLIGASND